MAPATFTPEGVDLILGRIDAAFDSEVTTDFSDLVMLTIPEVMRILDVSEGTVKRCLARGELASHRIGRLRRISVADLRRFIRSTRVITMTPTSLP